MTASCTIDDLLKQVPEGQSRLLEKTVQDATEGRFFAVHMSWDYGPGRLEWHNKPPLEKTLWAGSRTVPRNPISSAPLPDVTFDGPVSDIVDFYSSGTDAYFMSDKLADLIEQMDPGSLDRHPIQIQAIDGILTYNFVMPARNIEAVDPARSDILIKAKNYDGKWLRSIQFPNGAVFRDDALAGIHSFSDIDVRGWFWSRELIEAAKAARVRGIYTMAPGRVSGKTIDNL